MPRRMTRAERERFLNGRHVAVLVTTGPDGVPAPTPIWYRYRDGDLYFRTGAAAIKTLNATRDPRVALVVQDERAPYKFLTVYGTAEVREESMPWLARELPRHYLGMIGALGYRLSAEEQIQGGQTEVTLVVHPERYVTADFTPDTPVYGRLWLQAKRLLPPWL